MSTETVCVAARRCEVVLESGDLVIQRGTIHAWINRFTRMLFVLGAANFRARSRQKQAEHDA
jgi:hypothetical protein